MRFRGTWILLIAAALCLSACGYIAGGDSALSSEAAPGVVATTTTTTTLPLVERSLILVKGVNSTSSIVSFYDTQLRTEQTLLNSTLFTEVFIANEDSKTSQGARGTSCNGKAYFGAGNGVNTGVFSADLATGALQFISSTATQGPFACTANNLYYQTTTQTGICPACSFTKRIFRKDLTTLVQTEMASDLYGLASPSNFNFIEEIIGARLRRIKAQFLPSPMYSCVG